MKVTQRVTGVWLEFLYWKNYIIYSLYIHIPSR